MYNIGTDISNVVLKKKILSSPFLAAVPQLLFFVSSYFSHHTHIVVVDTTSAVTVIRFPYFFSRSVKIDRFYLTFFQGKRDTSSECDSWCFKHRYFHTNPLFTLKFTLCHHPRICDAILRSRKCVFLVLRDTYSMYFRFHLYVSAFYNFFFKFVLVNNLLNRNEFNIF